MELPGAVTSPPMSYLAGGYQYILMWVSAGGSDGATLLALTNAPGGGRGRGRGRGGS
jgi:hypothetical protein